MPGDYLTRKDIERIFRFSRSNVYSLLDQGKIPGALCTGDNRGDVIRSVFFRWLDENMVRLSGTAEDVSSYHGNNFARNPLSTWSSQADWMTVNEVVALTGFSRTALFRMIKDGEVPGAVRIGGSRRINRDVLIRWIFGDSCE